MFTKALRPPKLSRTFSESSVTDTVSFMSIVMPRARAAPCSLRMDSTDLSWCLSRAMTATCAPYDAKASAVSNPMPRVPPTTQTGVLLNPSSTTPPSPVSGDRTPCRVTPGHGYSTESDVGEVQTESERVRLR
jgi:hypothetical protein